MGATAVTFYDALTGDYLYTNTRDYDYPQAAYFYSYDLGAWLYYYEDFDDNNRRTFYNFATGQYHLLYLTGLQERRRVGAAAWPGRKAKLAPSRVELTSGWSSAAGRAGGARA